MARSLWTAEHAEYPISLLWTANGKAYLTTTGLTGYFRLTTAARNGKPRNNKLLG